MLQTYFVNKGVLIECVYFIVDQGSQHQVAIMCINM
jgi:hypothetical protein